MKRRVLLGSLGTLAVAGCLGYVPESEVEERDERIDDLERRLEHEGTEADAERAVLLTDFYTRGLQVAETGVESYEDGVSVWDAGDYLEAMRHFERGHGELTEAADTFDSVIDLCSVREQTEAEGIATDAHQFAAEIAIACTEYADAAFLYEHGKGREATDRYETAETHRTNAESGTLASRSEFEEALDFDR